MEIIMCVGVKRLHRINILYIFLKLLSTIQIAAFASSCLLVLHWHFLSNSSPIEWSIFFLLSCVIFVLHTEKVTIIDKQMYIYALPLNTYAAEWKKLNLTIFFCFSFISCFRLFWNVWCECWNVQNRPRQTVSIRIWHFTNKMQMQPNEENSN